MRNCHAGLDASGVTFAVAARFRHNVVIIKTYCRLKIELSSFEIHNVSFRNTGFFCVCVAFLSMAYLLLFG